MRENKYRDVKMSRVLSLEGSWHFYIAVKIEGKQFEIRGRKGRGGKEVFQRSRAFAPFQT